MPYRRSAWFDVSTREWIASESMAEDCVQTAAVNLATAIPKLHTSAMSTILVEPLDATANSLRVFRKILYFNRSTGQPHRLREFAALKN
jgi:hypothetical protein